jgi:hypothetical protein
MNGGNTQSMIKMPKLFTIDSPTPYRHFMVFLIAGFSTFFWGKCSPILPA